jgi:hypothetical protein
MRALMSSLLGVVPGDYPQLLPQLVQAVDENLIEKSEWDFCGSWSTVTDDGQATYLNLAHLGNIDSTDIRYLMRLQGT